MNDIMSKDYAKFLEETLQNIAELPVESICIMTKMTNGGFYTSCYCKFRPQSHTCTEF